MALAIILMTVRRCITLAQTISAPESYQPNLSAELVAIIISVLMLAGVIRIRYIFLRLDGDKKELDKNHRKANELNMQLQREIAKRKEAEKEIQGNLQSMDASFQQVKQEAEFEGRRRMEMEKMAAMGEMAAMVAHEINNPLAAMKNAFYLIQKAVPEDHPKHKFIELMQNEIQRMGDIIAQMYDLYRQEENNHDGTDLNQIIGKVIILNRSSLKRKKISLKDERQEDLPPIQAPQNAVMQILHNPFVNAMDAIEKGTEGTITIRTCEKDGFALVEIIDNGCGIDEEMRSRIFEPFVSSKSPAKGDQMTGMGLGLALTKSLIEKFKGNIEVDSKKGEGTCIRLAFPLFQKSY